MGADLNAVFEAPASAVVSLNGCRIMNAIVKIGLPDVMRIEG